MNATEQRIAAAAMRLFAERGSADLTMSELATEAGVARGTLYRNVESIEQLFDQVLTRLAMEVHARNVSVMDAHGDADPPLRLATGMRMLVRLAHEDPATGRFLVRFALSHQSLREMLSGPPLQDVAAGIAAGRYTVAPGMELGVASMLLGTTVSAVWMVLDGHQTWREAGSSAAELVLCALGVPRHEARQLATAPLPDLPAV